MLHAVVHKEVSRKNGKGGKRQEKFLDRINMINGID
jgi:hypothetical protein